MDRKRFVLVGIVLLLGAVTLFVVKERWDSREAATRTPDAQSTVNDGSPLDDAPFSMRKLGIARANFLGLKGPERKKRSVDDMSFGERRLLEKFQSGGLGRIANSTVFAAPDEKTILKQIEREKRR